jgi:uncharacterized membrane protein
MNLIPIAQAPLAIQIHLATVVPAFLIGTWQIFFSTKGSAMHRWLGAAYLVLMTVTAIAASFIRSVNPGGFSPVHLFIPLTLFSVVAALWYLRRGNIRGHRNAMLGLYVGGLVIAGTLTLLPGRLLHRVLFG